MRFLPLILLSLFIVGFFLPILFFPTPKLFATPDYGRSDIWNFNMPLKFFLSESLKRRELPLWNKDIGTGFPVLAEGQIGTFFLPNLILFGFLPFFLAWNLGYLLAFFTASFGTYLYGRKIGLSETAALLAALVFSFSAVFIVQVSHYNLIQANSLFPWLLLFTEYLAERKWYGFVGFVVLLSQQIFAGFPQSVLISLTAIIVIHLGKTWFMKPRMKNLLTGLCLFLAGLLLGIALSAAQVLPLLELQSKSIRAGGLSYDLATHFSFPWKNLVTFLNPYAFGDPRLGSYPFEALVTGSIFWENAGYMGVLPFIGALCSLLVIRKNTWARIYWFTALVALLLMTGKYSPLYFIYSFMPFSFFRVPSRFIILFVWSLTMLSSLTLNEFAKNIRAKRKNVSAILLTLFTTISLVDILFFAFYYNPTTSVADFEQVPQTARLLASSQGRILTVGNEFVWNEVFKTRGWQDMKPYLYFRSGLAENVNLFYHLSNLLAYTALSPRRLDILTRLVKDNIDLRDGVASISATGIKVLKLNNVQTLISSTEVQGSGLSENDRVQSAPLALPGYRLYKIPDPLPRAYLTTNATEAATVSEAVVGIWRSEFYPNAPVILEEKPQVSASARPVTGSITTRVNEHQLVTLDVTAEEKSYLVLADSFYPGWTATLDNTVVPILPANINQRAILVPPGQHRLSFTYQPKMFMRGLQLSLLGYIGFAAMTVTLILNSRRKRRLNSKGV